MNPQKRRNPEEFALDGVPNAKTRLLPTNIAQIRRFATHIQAKSRCVTCCHFWRRAGRRLPEAIPPEAPNDDLSRERAIAELHQQIAQLIDEDAPSSAVDALTVELDKLLERRA